MSYDAGDRNWSCATTNQGTATIAGNYQQWEESMALTSRPQEEINPIPHRNFRLLPLEL